MLKVMTLNIANYDDHPDWEKRSDQICSILTEENPDIIALQEVRFNILNESTRNTLLNAAEQIVYKLCEKKLFCDASIVTFPSRYFYANNNSEHIINTHLPSFSRSWEGLSIISKHKIIESGFINLTHKETSLDSNKRITQYITCDINEEHYTFFNVHFTFDEDCVQDNIQETVSYVNSLNPRRFLIMGDMNILNSHPSMHTIYESDLRDLWLKFKSCDPGFTYPAIRPIKRIDYIFANPAMEKKALNIRMINSKSNGSRYLSDHNALIAEFES